VAGDPGAETIGQAVDRPLQSGIVKRDQPTALLADHVVVVLAAGMLALEARLPIADREPLHEPVIDEQIEHAVDAGASGRATLGPQLILDLDCAERTGLRGKQLDHPLPRTAVLQARTCKHRMDVVGPRRRALLLR